MRNRAKCKLCYETIESFHQFDYVSCKCGEISISGGETKYEVSFRNPKNFLRIDDNGKEFTPVFKDIGVEEGETSDKPIGRLERLESTIQQLEALPTNAMQSPLNHYDLVHILKLIKDLFTAEEKNPHESKSTSKKQHPKKKGKHGKQDNPHQDS